MEQIMRIEQNKMGIQPTGKLLISMALPMIFSMIVMALYNVVDSIFVARINENALTAVSLAFPIQNLIIAVSVGIGVGANAVISKSLGEKKYERANFAAGNCLTLSFLASLIFLLFGIFGTKAFFDLQTQNAEIAQYGVDYLSVVSIFSFSAFGQIAFEKILASTGKTHLTMVMQLIGAVCNIILDPILIFGLFGFPELGIKGAAIATVVGQALAFFVALILNFVYNKEIKIKSKNLILKGYMVKLILVIGVPSIMMVAVTSIMNLAMNLILIKLSNTAVPVFGIYIKLQNFVFMPIFGINNGMIPIVSFNLGIKNSKRIKSTVGYAMIMAGIIMIFGLIVSQSFPVHILELFDASSEMLSIGMVALRIISISFLFAGFNIIASALFLALGRSIYSFFMSLFRQLMVLLPIAWLLSLTQNLNIVWWAFVIAEILSTCLSILLIIKISKKIKKDTAQNLELV